jgi:hypothetical protein
MSVVRFGVVQPVFTTGPAAVPATPSAKLQSAVSSVQSAWARAVATSHQAANILPALLSPVALIALVLGIWRLGADLGWTGDFVISEGFFSHWMVWMALALALQSAATSLSRLERKRAAAEN